MNSLVSWQLMLLLCATSFRETLEKVAPMETPGPAGMHFLGRGWEGAHELLENEGYHIFQSEASLLICKLFIWFDIFNKHLRPYYIQRGRDRQGARKSSKAECPANTAGLFPTSTLFASKREVMPQKRYFRSLWRTLETEAMLKERGASGLTVRARMLLRVVGWCGAWGPVPSWSRRAGKGWSRLPEPCPGAASPQPLRGSPLGQRLGAQALPAPWERSPPCAPQRHLMPARRGADLPAYNWNVFGLRYGRRRAATPGLRGGTPSPRLRVPVGWGLGLRS
ncbi:metastasis-suppressor KiSS-1 [Canis lupus dingo]|uniref:metastasis-suppressor KiSS-1 n=1 Tax=Canis lupus dingo TaxID=286419 RepID=UPI0015F18C66|nr:metastasis-suppressor KiSS-1 [Canis lupus dingo]